MSPEVLVPSRNRTRLSSTQKEIVSGLSAGCLVTLTTHPLDVLKVRLQLDTVSKTQAESYRRVLTSLVAAEGGVVRNLYRGITPNVVGNTVAWAAYFSLYRFYKDLAFRHLAAPVDGAGSADGSADGAGSVDSQLQSHHYLVSAYAAGITTSVVTNPIWVLKTRILSTSRVHPGAYQSIADGVQRILREEGARGFWRGVTPSLFGVLQGALQFSIYDTLKQGLYGGADLTLWQSIYLSAGCKLASSVTLYPFQVLKSRLQSYGNVQTVRQVLVSTYTRDGVRGFYKGLIPNVLRVLPATCITFGCYEQVKNSL